ncbi:MAG: hypothetical protein IH851_12145 [Armatimonadetes bacterium]|nr:hypothetical protein [Armatimonadota bacterium]
MRRASLLLGVAALLAASCGAPQDTAKKQGSVESDPLLGKWVCLADNVNEKPDATIEFREDGTAIFQEGNQKPVTWHYRREPGREWLSRRVSDPEQLQNPIYADWVRPGVEMISFADPQTGEFVDGGGSLLTLDPEQKILYNFITQLWCRPGDEARVRILWGMDAQEEEAKRRAEELKAWKPEKDVTARWRLMWTADLAESERGSYAIAVGDLDGDGAPDIVASVPAGFAILDEQGRVVNEIKTDGEPGPFLALGRHDGNGLVVMFRTWGHAVRAYDSTGRQLWTFGGGAGSRGVDWVAPVEIDGRNTGFVIGYNGGGIEFIGPDGKSRWRADVNANVWSVAGARLRKGLPGYAVCVGPGGALAFDAQGRQVHSYGPEDAGAVGAADLDGDGVDEVLTLGTTVVSLGRVTVFNADGRKKWSENASGTDVAFLDGNPFVFGNFGGKRLLGVANGMAIRLFDADGNLFGDFVHGEGIQAVATLPRNGGPDALLVRVQGQLRCYDLQTSSG